MAVISSRLRTGVRGVSLALFVGLAIWLLMPPKSDQTEAEAKAAQEQAANARFTIKLSPGFAYLPDTVPFGVGKPIHALRDVVREFEARFPDTKVDIVNTPTLREYLVTQLSSGRAPDIVNVNVEDVWTDVQKGWYVPLDEYFEQPNQFVVEKGDPNAPGYRQWWDMFKYQALSRGKAAPDGLSYCLTYDCIETAIFYNKDAFRKAGVQEPKDWDEFLEVCRKLKAAGYTPITSNIDVFCDWGTDLFLDQLYNNILPGIDLLKDPKREPFLQGYLDWDEIYFLHTKGFFTARDPRFVEMWKLLHEFRQYAGGNISSVDLTREFVTQHAAMYWMHSQFTYRLAADRELGFEWGVFYPPSFTTQTSEYASNVPMCVIGDAGSQFEVTNSSFSDTGDPKTSERLKRVIALLQFLCLPENSERITNEYPCLVPNIVGVPVLPVLKPFEEILERPYTTTKWAFTFDLRFFEIHRRMLELYLNDGIDLEGYLDWQEANLTTACDNLLKRKPVNVEALEAEWQRLAPARVGMKDLPNENR